VVNDKDFALTKTLVDEQVKKEAATKSEIKQDFIN